MFTKLSLQFCPNDYDSLILEKKNLKNIAKMWTHERAGRLKELDVWKAGYLKSWTSESWMSVCPSQLLLPCFLAFRVYSFTFQSDGSDCPAIVSSEQDQISQPKLQG